MMKSLLEGSLILIVSTGVGLLLEIVRVKVVAVILGPNGVGVISLLNNFHQVLFIFVCLGLDTGITKYTAQYHTEQNRSAIGRTASTAFTLSFFWALSISICIIVMSRWCSQLIFKTDMYALYISIYAVALPLAIYPMVTQSIFKGLKQIKALGLIIIYRTFFAMLIIIPLIYYFKINGAVLSILIITTAQWCLNAWYAKKISIPTVITFHQPVDWSIFKKIFHYGMTSIVLSSIVQLTTLVLRTVIVRTLGNIENGIYQCAWSLTFMYIGFALSSMSTYFYPRLCELKNNSDTIHEVNGMTRIALFIIVPLLFIIMIGKKFFITLLYSNEFIDAAPIIPFLLIGCFFEVLAAEVGGYILASKKFRILLVAAVINAVYLLISTVILMRFYGLVGVSIAFASNYLLKFIMFYGFAQKDIGFTFWPHNRRLVGASLVVLFILYMAEQLIQRTALIHTSIIYSAVCCVCCSLWLLFTIQKKEFNQLVLYTRQQIQRFYKKSTNE